MARPRMFKTHIDLPEDARHHLVTTLNQRLADTSDLYSQVKQAHWNVKGPMFFHLHELFDTLAAPLPDFMDMIAERVTALGGVAMGTVRMAAASSTLTELPLANLEGLALVEALVERYAIYAHAMRAGIARGDELNDMDTADLFTQISRKIDQHLWFLEAHLQQGKS